MKITKEVIDWDKVRTIVNEKTGKLYNKNYLMNVRNGYTGNKTLEKIFIELGVMK